MRYYLFGAGWNGEWIERPEQDSEFLVASELLPATEYTEDDDDEKERVSSTLEFKVKKVILSDDKTVLIAYYGDEPSTEHIETSIQ